MPLYSPQTSHFPIQSARRLLATLLSVALVAACSDMGKPADSVQVARRSLESASFAPDGSIAVVASLDEGGSLWRLADGERLFNWNHAEADESLILTTAVSPDGQWAATADRSTLVLWNVQSGEAERFWSTPARVTGFGLSAGGERALLGLNNELAMVFDSQRGGLLANLYHNDVVSSVALSSDGRFGLTGAEDQRARFWDIADGRVLISVEHEDDVQLVALSPDASLALSVSKYDKALLWNTRGGQIVGEIPLSAERVKRGLRFTAAAIDRTNRYLLTGRPDGVVELWSIDSLQRRQQWRMPKRNSWQPSGARVLAVAFSEEKGGFYAATSNGFIHFLTAKN